MVAGSGRLAGKAAVVHAAAQGIGRAYAIALAKADAKVIASSRKIQQEFEHICKRYWGLWFWGRGYFSTPAGNITEDVVMAYLDRDYPQGWPQPLRVILPALAVQ